MVRRTCRAPRCELSATRSMKVVCAGGQINHSDLGSMEVALVAALPAARAGAHGSGGGKSAMRLAAKITSRSSGWSASGPRDRVASSTGPGPADYAASSCGSMPCWRRRSRSRWISSLKDGRAAHSRLRAAFCSSWITCWRTWFKSATSFTSTCAAHRVRQGRPSRTDQRIGSRRLHRRRPRRAANHC